MPVKGLTWKKLSQLYEETPSVDAAQQVGEAFPGYEGLWCRYIMTVTNLGATYNAVILVHGPLSCVAAVRLFKATNYSFYYGQPFQHLPTTDMDNSAVIMGGDQRLVEAIKAVDRDYRPPLIIVVDTCAPAIIGDDVEFAIEQAQPEVRARLAYIPTPGFTSPWLGRSIELCVQKYVDIMDPPERVDPEKVNILGQYKETFCTRGRGKGRGEKRYPDDADELGRLIEALGLRLHRVLTSGDYDYIRTAPEAAVNTFSCPTWSYPLARAMKERFGTPFLRHAIPTGFGATARWVRELAEFSGREEEAEGLIAREYAELEEEWESCREMARGRVALIEGGRNTRTAFARPMAYGRMCRELGMETYFFNIHPLEIKAKRDDVEYFLWDGYDPPILSHNYPYDKPVSAVDVMKNLGLEKDQVVYFIEDVYPYARAGMFDASDAARVDSSVHHRRVREAPGRGIGFRGARAIARQIKEAIKAGRRKSKPTLYGRIHGASFDYQLASQVEREVRA